MNTALLKDAVSATTYPGRGIILGTNDAGKAVRQMVRVCKKCNAEID